MKSSVMVGTLVLACGFTAYSCKPSDDDDSKGTGASGGKAASGGKSGTAAAGAGGKSAGGTSATSGGSAGSGEVGGEAGGPGGQAGRSSGGGSGGSIASGGHGGSQVGSGGASGTGGSSVAGAAGDAGQGGGASTEPEKREDLAGPDRDQPILSIDASYVVDTDMTGFLVVNGAPGDVFVMDKRTLAASHVAKYTSGALKWNYELYSGVTAIQAADDGGVFYSGSTTTALPGETEAGTRDALVGKLDADGNEAWTHQWGSPGTQYDSWLAAGPGGSVLATGTCNDLAPGNAAEMAGGFTVVRYEGDGTRAFLGQYRKAGQLIGTPNGILVDPTGNSYIAQEASRIVKISPEGVLGTVSDVELGVPTFGRPPGYITDYQLVAWAPDHKAFYEWTARGVSTPGTLRGLFKIRLDGKVEWYRLSTERSATTDSSGTVWKGHFEMPRAITVTDDSIYLAGLYTNSYQLPGGVPNDSSVDAVGRYDLDGNPIWIQDIEESSAGILGISVGVDGNPVVVVNGPGGVAMIKLGKADGSAL